MKRVPRRVKRGGGGVEARGRGWGRLDGHKFSTGEKAKWVLKVGGTATRSQGQ